MIQQALKKIIDLLLQSEDTKLQGVQLSMPEADSDYMQGTYFERLGAQHHRESLSPYFVHPYDQSSTDYRNAMWNFLSAALKGHKEAQYRLGIGYLNAELGLDRNYELALLWLNRAAAQGHIAADHALKHSYEEIAF